MRRNKLVEIISLLIRIFLGFVFLYAAIGKIYDPNAFFKEIANYRIFPNLLSQIFAIFLPWVELIIGIFLIFGIRLRSTSFFSSVLLLTFTILVISAWVRGLNINCGCFSHHIEYVGLGKVMQNFVLILLSVFIFIYPKSLFSIEEIFSKNFLSTKESEHSI